MLGFFVFQNLIFSRASINDGKIGFWENKNP